MLGWMIIGGISCAIQEPVLLVLGDEGDAADAVSGSEPEVYEKAEDVLVDVARFAGRSLDEVRGELEEQMGATVAIVELNPREGREIRLGSGLVREVDGAIYLVRVDLPHPMRRSEAMRRIGLPPQVRKWLGFSNEWRAAWLYGFERVRMGREERGSEFVVWVEALKSNPRKR